ncbi:MAG TPA: hypothetical protein VE195_09150 [Acidobacteriaceae bacterium]|nr:hypothetical protein [Acidobacteriaceae bacterium]
MGAMPDPIASRYIDRDQAIRIASRLFAAFLLFWFLVDLSYLPRQVLAILPFLNQSSAMAQAATGASRATYMLRYYASDILANLFRMAVLLMAAGWFYRCGPRIRKFFGAGAE